NMEVYHHGVGTPDLGLGAYRAATIANQLVGEELFKLDHSQSFQQFGVNAPAQEEVSVRNIAASKITEFSRPLNKSGPMHHSALGAYARSKLSEHIE
ncbi:ornithine monooxygenase, partial [Acinetobacter baumannii]